MRFARCAGPTSRRSSWTCCTRGCGSARSRTEECIDARHAEDLRARVAADSQELQGDRDAPGGRAGAAFAAAPATDYPAARRNSQHDLRHPADGRRGAAAVDRRAHLVSEKDRGTMEALALLPITRM